MKPITNMKIDIEAIKMRNMFIIMKKFMILWLKLKLKGI